MSEMSESQTAGDAFTAAADAYAAALAAGESEADALAAADAAFDARVSLRDLGAA